mmetsp:Transcript_72643/g.213084  ORF Transcript_72643/g.213084 Transcript_72643/m.213084 type:complete len:215 (-) Transcript_72643:887-1531(-)
MSDQTMASGNASTSEASSRTHSAASTLSAFSQPRTLGARTLGMPTRAWERTTTSVTARRRAGPAPSVPSRSLAFTSATSGHSFGKVRSARSWSSMRTAAWSRMRTSLGTLPQGTDARRQCASEADRRTATSPDFSLPSLGPPVKPKMLRHAQAKSAAQSSAYAPAAGALGSFSRSVSWTSPETSLPRTMLRPAPPRRTRSSFVAVARCTWHVRA